MTKTEVYNTLIDLVNAAAENNADFALDEDTRKKCLERLKKDIESVSKKSSNKAKAKVNTTKNALVSAITEVLTNAGRPLSIPEIMSDLAQKGFVCDDGKTLTSQRVSAILTYMGKGGKNFEGLDMIERTMEKKVAYFALKEEEEAEVE